MEKSKSVSKEGEGGDSPSQLIDARIEELSDWRGETLARLRALIKQADPEVVEDWKWRGVPVFSHDGIICTGETYKNVVKMTFAKGASLEDPSGLFNSSLEGNTRRAIDFHEGDEIDREGAHSRRRGTEHVHSRPAAGDERIDDREGFEAQWGEPRMSASMAAEPAARLRGPSPQIEGTPMKIKLTSVYVDDQEKALLFYTEVLGFAKKADFSQGPYRWLTVASPEDPDGTELQLALNDNPAAKAYQQAMFQQGQPAVMFFSDDVKGDYERIKARGADFTMAPTQVPGSTIARLNDSCGNLIQITQLARW
jgi:predicted enzyme related to lactoylglutathione lyase